MLGRDEEDKEEEDERSLDEGAWFPPPLPDWIVVLSRESEEEEACDFDEKSWASFSGEGEDKEGTTPAEASAGDEEEGEGEGV